MILYVRSGVVTWNRYASLHYGVVLILSQIIVLWYVILCGRNWRCIGLNWIRNFWLNLRILYPHVFEWLSHFGMILMYIQSIYIWWYQKHDPIKWSLIEMQNQDVCVCVQDDIHNCNNSYCKICGRCIQMGFRNSNIGINYRICWKPKPFTSP